MKFKCQIKNGERHEFDDGFVMCDNRHRNGFICTRERGHDGNHCACGTDEHNCAHWENSAEAGWEIKYDNDTGPNDEGFEQWWDVDGNGMSFRCWSEEQAEWLKTVLEKEGGAK